MNARIATLRLFLMLVSRVCLGINVFDVNIEREGKENPASVSTIRIGNVEFPCFHPALPPSLFYLASLFLWSFLRFIANCLALTRMRNCSVANSLPPAFHLLFTLFAPGVIAKVFICSANSFSMVIIAYFIFLLWFRNPYFAYCLVVLILFVLAQSDKVRNPYCWVSHSQKLLKNGHNFAAQTFFSLF